ncbi:MAG TPA: DUF4307 domain-containing protein [Stackebrandtia sp.]|jgi:hypothetical protein|uniref:DUF4307 domain-containing protein n=1 Tax=Stackebrandtia sp. TaxID=2023065 RepID=UPI002D2A9CD8|nr:DUF4307 domain-containing protein [Stackebrandtia sp.]HZE40755.1 DUF4307 domain-containing protein [Stackebrandtia sp.]
MDETRATGVRFPPGRYGRRRERPGMSRWLIGGGASVALLMGFVIAVLMYQQYGEGDYRNQVLGFNTADSSVRITFEVVKPAGAKAACQVRARSADGAEVGHAVVEIPGRKSDVRVKYTLDTSARPVVAEVLRCYPRS